MISITNNILLLFINLIFSLFIYASIIRFLIQWAGVPLINPFAQIILKITRPIIKPFSYIVGTYKNYNLSVVLLAVILEVLYVIVLIAVVSHSFPDIGGLLLWALATLVQQTSNVLLYGTVIYALMSWFPSLTTSPLGQCIIIIINPFVDFFRRIIPSFGGLDFSPMAFILLMIIIRMLLQPILYYAVHLALA
jgi:YggT family protein